MQKVDTTNVVGAHTPILPSSKENSVNSDGSKTGKKKKKKHRLVMPSACTNIIDRSTS